MDLQTIEKIKKEAHPKLREELQKIYEEANNKLGKSRLRFSMILRTFKEQDDIYAQGRTKKGKIVTDAKAGFRKGFLINDYDQLENTLQVIVLPDNEFNFGFGAGGIYIVKDGRIFPYGEIFLRKNLFRIR